jgi:uncharacterized protein (DUF362 family)
MDDLTRRTFLKSVGVTGGAFAMLGPGQLMAATGRGRVALTRTDERSKGVKTAIRTLGVNPVKNKDVLIKPNFNTADRFPGSTDNDTLVALVKELWEMGAKSVSLGERSYPPTDQVMEKKGIRPLMRELQVKVINFDTLAEKDWPLINSNGGHWKNGFRVARPILESECLVSTCCLKTHQYGGVFTMSLKLHVGVVPTTRHGYDYMTELHSSPHQRKMIAEINEPFSPSLVVMDAMEAFVDGGPMVGKRAPANLFLASTDRVAMDAVGVAILKDLGSNDAIMNKRIFEQEQIARGVELGLGVSGPGEINIESSDEKSREPGDRLMEILAQG